MEFNFLASSLMSSNSGESVSNAESGTKLDQMPVEIHGKILSYVEISDVLNYGCTCRLFHRYSENQQLWKLQWIRLSSKTPFTYIPAQSMTDLAVNFKDSCHRLWRILINDNQIFGSLTPYKCLRCREFTCTPACIEERTGSKVSIDIGGKMTWFVKANAELERHLSMVAIPKLIKCYDCDKNFHRDELVCDCSTSPMAAYGAAVQAQGGHCQHRDCQCHSMASHTGLEYRSQTLANIQNQPVLYQPFCIFCDEQRMNGLLQEHQIVTGNKERLKRERMQYSASMSEEDFRNHETFMPLTNGYCKDTASILCAENMDILSPVLALEHIEAFAIVKSFLTHLLLRHNMVEHLQRPSNSIILTVPCKIPYRVKESLLKFFFEETKAARVCLLPKALAIAQLYNVNTCIVVDSGATCTSVSVVINGKVDMTRCQNINVGGWHVSQFLKQALDWKNQKDNALTTVSSLDTSAVKQKCRLSLNLNRETPADYCRSTSASSNSTTVSNGSTSTSETLHIKSQRDSNRRLEMTEVQFSSELFMAPEMMYCSLELPSMVEECTKELPDHILKECFSNILITGGNTELRGFDQRFSRDLRELMPEHSPIINVRNHPSGNHSWNTVTGAYSAPVPMPYENVLTLNDPGSALWMTREEYITFGYQTIAVNDNILDEDG